MCTGGFDDVIQAEQVIRAARDRRYFINACILERRAKGKREIQIRLDIHHSPAVAGVVGIRRFAFDIWGDMVNIAARIEGSNEPGKINVSGEIYALIKEHFKFEYRGKSAIKNKGLVEMYFVELLEEDPDPIKNHLQSDMT